MHDNHLATVFYQDVSTRYSRSASGDSVDLPLMSGTISTTVAASDRCTVEPVYNGPLLSGQFSKSGFFAHTNAVFVTRIRRPPLLSGRGHPVAVLCLSFFVIFACIKRPPLNGH